MRSFKSDSKGAFFLKAFLFLLIFVLAANALGFALEPAESFTRLMLHDLYAQKGGIDLALAGASHALYGFDTSVIDSALGVCSFNLGSASQKAMDSYYLLKEMYRENQPQVVVIELTYAMYTTFSGYDNPMSSIILFDHYRLSANKLAYLGDAFSLSDYCNVFLKAYRYRDRFSEIPDTLQKKLSAGYLSYDPASPSYGDERYMGKGFVSHMGGFQEGGLGRMTPYKWNRDMLNTEELSYLKRMIDLCKSEGSRVALVSAPLPVATLLTLGNYDDAHRFFAEIARENGVPYFDFNLARQELYSRPDSHYFDTNHLNGKGAVAFSLAFCEVLSEWERGGDPSTLFYPDFESLSLEYGRVANVYLQAKTEGDTLILTAKACGGASIEIEYRFLCQKPGESAFRVLQGFSPEPAASVVLEEGQEQMVRVEARSKGTNDIVFDELAVGGEALPG